MRIKVQEKGGCDLLRGRVLGSVFYEPSTRTSCSFQSAMQRLGGTVIDLKKETSSLVKGESIEGALHLIVFIYQFITNILYRYNPNAVWIL